MKTKIIFLNPLQIGGCSTLISYGDTTICIDYGDNLPGADMSRFESIDWENEKVNAVFFTHYHGDHIGRFMEIPPEVPLYMGGATRNVEMIIHKHLAGFGEDAVAHGQVLERLEGIPAAQELKKDQSVTIGKPGEEIRVTPYIVDHSAYEAWMLLVETPDKVILHTGDYRGHGYIGKNGKTMLNVIEKYVRRYGKRNVDILITEGTMMSREREKVLTEPELQRKARKLFKDNRHVFLICSSTNLDSLTSFYQAMTGRYPDSAIYGSQYLVEQLDYYSMTAGPKSDIYRFRNRFPYLSGSGGSRDTQIKRKKQQAMMRKNGFLCVIKPEERYEKWVAPFRDLNPLFVYSMWDGYFDKEKHPHSYKPEWAAFRERHADYRWVDLHTAGHATPELICEVILAVDPKEAIYPIHTENADGFKTLSLPKRLRDRIKSPLDRTEKKFARNITAYDSKEIVSDARELVCKKTEKKLLPISQSDGLYIYSDGYPIITMRNNGYDIFSTEYDKYMKNHYEGINKVRRQNNKHDVIMEDEEFLNALMKSSEECDPHGAERRSEQYIALNHQSYAEDQFTVCGMETAIASNLLDGTTRGKGKQAEIDMIAIRPKDKKVYVIEYKCGQGTLGTGINASLKTWNFEKEEKNIVAHCKDLLAFMEIYKSIGFVKEMINAFNLQSRIVCPDHGVFRIGTDKETIREYENNLSILFLLTNKPKEGVVSKQKELTKNSYENLRHGPKHSYMPRCFARYEEKVKEQYKSNEDKRNELKKNVDNIRFFAALSPEQVDLNSDSQYVSIDNLRFPS